MHSIKMRRNNKILLGLLAMLLVMSTGYALFSKEITIGGNVTAKGSFKIDFTCTKGVSNEVITAWATEESMTTTALTQELNKMQHGYSTDTCSASGTTVTTTTALSYPGATRFYTIEVKNSGDIPAKWHYEDGFTGTATMCYGSNASVCQSDEATYEVFAGAIGSDEPSAAIAGIKDSSGTFNFIMFEDIIDVVDTDGYIILEPGDSMHFLACNTWGSTFSGDQFNYAYGNFMTYQYSMKFNFEQATE